MADLYESAGKTDIFSHFVVGESGSNPGSSVAVIRKLSPDGWANFSYAVVGENNAAWCVDPWDGSTLFEALQARSVSVAGIINTHQHPDHVRGNDSLHRLSGAPVLDRGALLKKGTLELGASFFLEVVEAPGHTMDHLVFLLRQEGRIMGIFSGDVLFNFGVGSCKNGGDVATLFHTIQVLDQMLPDACLLYPGHDYMETNLGFAVSRGDEGAGQFMDEFEAWEDRPTPMALERKINPFLKVRTLDEFKTLRALRDRW